MLTWHNGQRVGAKAGAKVGAKVGGMGVQIRKKRGGQSHTVNVKTNTRPRDGEKPAKC